MSKKDLIDAVAEAAELSKDKAGVAVEAVIKHIEKTMKDGQEVRGMRAKHASASHILLAI